MASRTNNNYGRLHLCPCAMLGTVLTDFGLILLATAATWDNRFIRTTLQIRMLGSKNRLTAVIEECRRK